MKLAPIDRSHFVASITTDKADTFAKTFLAKADMLGIWGNCYGIVDDNQLTSAIITTYSTRKPLVANLQLLHTFAKHRGKGHAKFLCEHVVKKAFCDGCEYFRVSAEKNAVEFYKKIGFRFLGEQKSGSQLSMFILGGERISEATWIIDPFIKKQIEKKGKGGCVKIY